MINEDIDSLTPREVFNTLENFIVHATPKFEEINERFDRIDQVLSKLDKLDKLDKIDQTLIYHETWLRQIDSKLEGMATKDQFNSLLSILEVKTVLNHFEVDHVKSR